MALTISEVHATVGRLQDSGPEGRQDITVEGHEEEGGSGHGREEAESSAH